MAEVRIAQVQGLRVRDLIVGMHWAQVLEDCGMKRSMDAPTLEQRAGAVAAQFNHAADSHEPAVAAEAALAAATGLARYAAGVLEDMFEPAFLRRLGDIAFVPAALVGMLAFGIVCALLVLKRYQPKENALTGGRSYHNRRLPAIKLTALS